MAHIALDDFFKTETKRGLSNLDWLDVDMEEYNNLPFDSVPEYITIPKLEEAWTHENDDSKLKLIPNSDFNFNYKAPKKSSMDEDIKELVKFAKKQMMSGKVGDDLVNSVKERTNVHVIKAAYKELAKLAEEQGLLGTVYVDPTVFSSCREGSEFLKKRAKTAKYVTSMSSCADCTQNNCGRCSLFKRNIRASVEYNESLYNFYSKHLSSVQGKDVRIASRDDLKEAFIDKHSKKTTEIKVAEFKPKISEELGVTLESKKEDFQKQMEDLKKDLSSIPKASVASELSTLIVKGYSDKVIKDHILTKFSSEERRVNSSVFSSVLGKLGSLGRVYVEASLLPIDLLNEKATRNFLAGYVNKTVRYVLVDSSFKNKKGYDKFSNICRKMGKEIVFSIDDIPRDAWKMAFSEYSETITSKLSSVFEKNPPQGLRLAYIQNEKQSQYKEPVVQENFELKKKLSTEIYNPPKKEASVVFTSEKISFALDKGFTFSSIIKTGKELGVSANEVKSNLSDALNKRSSLQRYQIDASIEVPEGLEIKATQKDISIDMAKTLKQRDAHEILHNSSEAPVDTLTAAMGLIESELVTAGLDKKSEDIEIEGLGEFTIE